MADNKKVRVAVIGLNFGHEFVPNYLHHPDVEHVGVCDVLPARLENAKKSFGVDRLHSNLDEVLASPDYDAVHLLTPVRSHASLAIKAMLAGKHCACAVPMGISRAELEQVIAAQKRSGLNYMMMETAAYSREYLYAKGLYGDGTLGNIQFMRGCHSQDLEEYNPEWRGFPPMWYITHAIVPLLDLLDTQATETVCFGSGVGRPEFTSAYGNPYPIAVALFSLKNSPAKAEIFRTLFDVAPYGDEAFDLFGDKATFATIGRSPLLTTISPREKTGQRRTMAWKDLRDIPFRPDLLPEPMRRFADGGHGGSHPHLVHEFIRSIVEERAPYSDARRSANWCIPGICAHESAMNGGEKITIPNF